MPPENFRFGGGPSESILHPIVLVAMLFAILLIFLLPRRHVILPVLFSVFWIPLGQEILIGGLHFFVYRIIILAVCVRMLAAMFSSPEGVFGNRLSNLDVVFGLWALFRALASVLSFSFQSGAVINQSAFLLDAIGGFFLLRYLIRDDEDIYRVIRAFAVISAVIACFMVYERLSGVNLFGALGGVRLESEVRNGSVRSQGPFQHELLAGTFGATLLPLFFLLWKSGKSHLLGIVGAVGSTVMVLTSQSSTPALAYLAAVGGICCFGLRRHMRLMRWGIVAALIALQMVMNAPVWYVIRHVDVIGGSSGYHRAQLVNDFIMHFRDWWLIGTTENARWGFNMWDLCNQFVAEGEVGGLATFICFVALVCICFSRIGTARKTVEGDRAKEWYFWLLGCALFSHVIAFFGISYFDQTRFAWFALLAMIATATAVYLPVKSPGYGRVPLRQPLPNAHPVPFGAFRSRIQSRAAFPLKWPAR
jgi:hypothetical protein